MSKSKTDFSSECLRIADLYGRTAEDVANLMSLHGVDRLPLCRAPNDGYGDFVSDLTGTVNTEPSFTKQEFTEMSDPNWILDRFARGQDISMFLSSRTPLTGDFTDVPGSFHEVMNTAVAGRQQFDALPYDVRMKFGNNPVAFIDFAMNPANKQALIDMGLLPKPEGVTPLASASSPAANAKEGGEGA